MSFSDRKHYPKNSAWWYLWGTESAGERNSLNHECISCGNFGACSSPGECPNPYLYLCYNCMDKRETATKALPEMVYDVLWRMHEK